jgi:hypothetical protein
MDMQRRVPRSDKCYLGHQQLEVLHCVARHFVAFDTSSPVHAEEIKGYTGVSVHTFGPGNGPPACQVGWGGGGSDAKQKGILVT